MALTDPDFTVDVHDEACPIVCDRADDAFVEVVLAPGAGAPADSEPMALTARGLAERGVTCWRFDFPYMVKAAAVGKRRPPNREPVLLETWTRVLELVASEARAPIALAGRSMGGRMASVCIARGLFDVKPIAVVYFGYPLHPAKKPERERSAHLPEVGVPQLFVSGTRDALAAFDRLEEVVTGLQDAELFAIDGADHVLTTSRKEPFLEMPRILDRVVEFLRECSTAC